MSPVAEGPGSAERKVTPIFGFSSQQSFLAHTDAIARRSNYNHNKFVSERKEQKVKPLYMKFKDLVGTKKSKPFLLAFHEERADDFQRKVAKDQGASRSKYNPPSEFQHRPPVREEHQYACSLPLSVR